MRRKVCYAEHTPVGKLMQIKCISGWKCVSHEIIFGIKV